MIFTITQKENVLQHAYKTLKSLKDQLTNIDEAAGCMAKIDTLISDLEGIEIISLRIQKNELKLKIDTSTLTQEDIDSINSVLNS